MDGAEGVGHVHIGQGGQGLGKLGVVLLLPLVKAEILQQHDLAGLKGSGLGLGILTDDVLGEDDLLAQQLAQPLGHRSQRKGLLPLPLGLAQMGAGDDGGPLLQQVFQGWQGGHDALIVGDGSGGLVLGNVEVAAAQHLLPLHIDVAHGLLVVVHGTVLLSESHKERNGGTRPHGTQSYGPNPAISPSPLKPGNPCCFSAS